MASRRVHLLYGREGLDIEVPGGDVTVLEPQFVEGLPDEAAGFRAALRQPIDSRPLKELVRPGERLAVVIPDITRPLPSERLLPWLFAELDHLPAERVTIINGTGSHRANSPQELAGMVGREIAGRYRIVNHDAHAPATLARAGAWPDGQPLLMNREYVEAERRVVLGFIEPHFMAGFSGGYKGVFPAVADIDSIMRYHGATVIGDPRSTWGLLEGNPTQALIRQLGAALPLDFCINVTLNRQRRITRFFCGEPLEAHRQGAAFSKSTAMVGCERPYEIVVTTNSGYPLDQNLYQAVKGMSAAAQVVREGGHILAAARCNDGFPHHGNFKKLLLEHESPQAILKTILTPGFSRYDQWEAQILAQICLKARVGLYSELPAAEVRAAHLEPVSDCAQHLRALLGRPGQGQGEPRIAVLPEGPMTIPYLIA